MSGSRTISILLADDHGLVRDMLRQRLEAEPDFRVVAATDCAEDALREALRLEPEVVLLDIDMPGRSPFEAARELLEQRPSTRVLFLSAFVQDRYIQETLSVQAAGYLSKTESPAAVVQAIRTAASGASCFSPEVQARIVVDDAGVRLSSEPQTRMELLTDREREVLGYIARGMAKKEMARLMGISVKTVDQHCSHIMEKLDLHDRVELARFAIREGLAEA